MLHFSNVSLSLSWIGQSVSQGGVTCSLSTHYPFLVLTVVRRNRSRAHLRSALFSGANWPILPSPPTCVGQVHCDRRWRARIAPAPTYLSWRTPPLSHMRAAAACCDCGRTRTRTDGGPCVRAHASYECTHSRWWAAIPIHTPSMVYSVFIRR